MARGMGWVVAITLLAGLVTGPAAAADQQGADPEELVRRYIEEIVQGEPAVIAELVAPDYVLTVNGDAEPIRGVDALTQLVAKARVAFPDLTCVAEELVVAGDRVAVRWTCRGTHQVAVLGVAPTGRAVTVHGMSLVRIAGGQVVEDDTIVDLFGLLQQLEATPLPSGTPADTVASPAVLSDEAGLVDAFTARGLTVEAVDTVRQPFLQVPGRVLVVRGGALAMPAELQVYPYPDAAAAAADAAAIGPDGQPATIMVTWIAPPHFFQRGPLLVIYLGDDPAALRLLTELVGPPFAEP